MVGRLVAIGGVIVLIVLGALGFFVFRQPEEASAPIEAIPLSEASSVAVAETAAPAAETAAPTAATAEPAATTEAVADATAAPAAETAAPAAAQTFEIVQAESQARFLIDEVLQGAPVKVVGATDQVAGQIAIDVSNPQNSVVGPIQINARTLTTDNDFRNRAIKNAILNTNEFEFVTFTPQTLSGLPATAAVGTPFTFQVTGELTIKDVTRPATFEVTVTPISETQIEGLATTTILYRDYELNIPDSPAVDTVADEVVLELDFVAQALA